MAPKLTWSVGTFLSPRFRFDRRGRCRVHRARKMRKSALNTIIPIIPPSLAAGPPVRSQCHGWPVVVL
eukprot:7087385-Pyramimonas_sp.AAC.1